MTRIPTTRVASSAAQNMASERDPTLPHGSGWTSHPAWANKPTATSNPTQVASTFTATIDAVASTHGGSLQTAAPQCGQRPPRTRPVGLGSGSGNNQGLPGWVRRQGFARVELTTPGRARTRWSSRRHVTAEASDRPQLAGQRTQRPPVWLRTERNVGEDEMDLGEPAQLVLGIGAADDPPVLVEPEIAPCFGKPVRMPQPRPGRSPHPPPRHRRLPLTPGGRRPAPHNVQNRWIGGGKGLRLQFGQFVVAPLRHRSILAWRHGNPRPAIPPPRRSGAPAPTPLAGERNGHESGVAAAPGTAVPATGTDQPAQHSR